MKIKKSEKQGIEDAYDDGKPANKWGYWIALAADGMDIGDMPLGRWEKLVLRMIVLFRKIFRPRSDYDE